MGTITKRMRKDGTAAYRAEVVTKEKGKIVHRQYKTFDKKSLAVDWAKRIEIGIQEHGIYKSKNVILVGDVIAKYIELFPPTGRTKRFDLSKLMVMPIAKQDFNSITAKVIIDHIRWRCESCKPQTANNDLIWLSNVARTMREYMSLSIDMEVFETAKRILKKERLIARGEQRSRLPTSGEILALSRHFHGHWMFGVWWFALYSARRQSEITSLLWSDLDREKRTIVVRDIKDPRKKKVTKKSKVPKSAFKVIEKYGDKTNKRIFPYKQKTISAYFTRACHMLGIKDLKFHDSRHAAITNLFKKGLGIPQVQQISLHADYKVMQRYVNLTPDDVDI